MKPNADNLFHLFGGPKKLAEAIGLDDGGVSRWNKEHRRGGHGVVPPQHNAAIREAAHMLQLDMAQVEAQLEPDVCPCCGQGLPVGTVVPRRFLVQP